MHTPILISSALLALAFLSTRLASWLRVPHSVFLVVLGILGGLGLQSADLPVFQGLERQYPDIVLFLLLPPLVFESAYQMDSRQFMADWLPTGTLAVFGMLLNCALVGLGLHWWLPVPLLSGLLFGALISATDPVAVVALFKEVGSPNRLATLVEGESLLNDGTALVLYRVLLGAALGGTVQPAAGLLQFVSVCLGGIVVGGLFSLLVSWMLRLTADSGPAQVGLTVSVAYSSFIVADQWFHVSGVLATLTVGLYLGRQARMELNREALHSMRSLWEFVALSANSLVFLAVGLTVDMSRLWQSASLVPAVLLIVFLARVIAVVASLGPLSWLGWGKPVSLAYQAVIVWAGLRGGLALALVLMLPADLPDKPLYLALATAVVLTSLLFNALTTGWLLARLGLDRLSDREQGLYVRSLQQTLDGVFATYSQAAERGTLSAQVVRTVQESCDQLLRSASPGETDDCHEAQKLLLLEQRHYDEQLELGIVSAPAYHRLCWSVRERLRRLEEYGPATLAEFHFHSKDEGGLLGDSDLDRLALQLEVLLHLNVWLDSQRESLQLAWRDAARSRLDEFYRRVPHLGVAVQQRFLSHSIYASATDAMRELAEAGIISGAILSRAREALDSFLTSQREASAGLFRPSTLDLLNATSLFSKLPDGVLERLQSPGRLRTIAPDTEVFSEGAPGHSCFLVLRGMLVVTSRSDRAETSRLFAGALFGEASLLRNSARTATVTSEVECLLLEIDRELFGELMDQHPDFRAQVQKLTTERVP